MDQTRRWFHNNISGKDAESLLLTKGKDGSFLVRPSQANPGDFSLSVRRGSSIVHIRIQGTEEFYDLYGGEKFATLAELIEYYTDNPNTLKETNKQVINIKEPVFTEQVTLQRWYHSGVTGKEAEVMLKDKGHTGSFLVRPSYHSPGDYVLSTRYDEETILHIKINCKNEMFDVGAGPPFNTLEELVDYYRQTPIIDKSSKVVRLKQPINATKIVSANIHERIQDLSKKSPGGAIAGKGGFWEEFEQLQQNECKHLFGRKEGAKQENRSKNRFKNILPFDHTRVVLKDGDGSDYINANYIRRRQDSEEADYIATQGALPATVVDFWRMVFQENTRIIVMTTNEIERGRVKCHAYWPALQKEQTFGRITVKNLNEYTLPHYILRELLVQKAPKEDEMPLPPRTVFHYHFKAWPDHGVPQDTVQVLGFLKDVNKRQAEMEETKENPGPITVHCSAGIGRTGTFIIIDMLLRKIEEEGTDTAIDIQQQILQLRKQRSGMVQTEAQYKFIYMALSSEIFPKPGLPNSSSPVNPSLEPPTASMKKVAVSSHPGVPLQQEAAYANLSYLKDNPQNGNGDIPPPLPNRRH